MSAHNENDSVSRRDFLATSASAAALLAIGAEAVEAQARRPARPAAPPKPQPARPPAPAKPAPSAAAAPPVNCAVIGLGPHGRELLAAISRVAGANVAAICDIYAPFLRRGQEGAPKAAAVEDYRRILDRPDIPAIFIATPTHKHREIVEAAVQAGKHVYCEAPIAHTLEDARAIARAGLAARASKRIFQVGLQYRANPQHHHVEKFVRTGVLKTIAQGRAQWHKKTSWRRSAPTDEREREINWRLRRETSPGLIGEIGIHSISVANWFFRDLPVAVSGFGSTIAWKDGRDVPDTVQCVLEYPGGVRFLYDATLANSFDGSYELFMGTDAAVLLRDERAWLFKEADSPLLGWEVYARKESIGDETGIALVADATQQLKEGKLPGHSKPQGEAGKTALFFSVEQFLNLVRGIGEKKEPDCGPVEGYQAAVVALKANEAVLKGTTLTFEKEWFTL